MSQHRQDPEPNGLDERFADWVDGRLDEQALRELEAELARDPGLRRRAEDYCATVKALREQLVVDEPPRDLVAGVMHQVRRQASPFRRLWPVLASVAAAAALVITMVLLNRPQGPGLDMVEETARHDPEADKDVADTEEQAERASKERAELEDGVAKDVSKFAGRPPVTSIS